MSHCVRRLRPPLPEALGLAMLIYCWKPLGVFDWGPGSLSWVDEGGRTSRQVAKSCLPTLIVGWKVMAWITFEISSF
jgi:hypothetical protein